jgi:hypothetical protein
MFSVFRFVPARHIYGEHLDPNGLVSSSVGFSTEEVGSYTVDLSESYCPLSIIIQPRFA